MSLNTLSAAELNFDQIGGFGGDPKHLAGISASVDPLGHAARSVKTAQNAPTSPDASNFTARTTGKGSDIQR